jgi:hypothetical protein
MTSLRQEVADVPRDQPLCPGRESRLEELPIVRIREHDWKRRRHDVRAGALHVIEQCLDVRRLEGERGPQEHRAILREDSVIEARRDLTVQDEIDHPTRWSGRIQQAGH